MTSPDQMNEGDSSAVNPLNTETPTWGEVGSVWTKIGFLSFGGPAGQIAMMHRAIVDEKKWVTEERFLAALNYCMLLPGPEAQQLATYLGWRTHGILGGILAGAMFVLPGALVMLGLSIVYVLFSGIPSVEGILLGIKAAVLAIIAQALIKIGQRVMDSKLKIGVSIAAFFLIAFFDVPFPVILALAALVGVFFFASKPSASVQLEGESEPVAASARRGAFISAAIWIAGILVAIMLTTGEEAYTDLAYFFSKLAVITFGGAYAVLAYMTDQAVNVYGWLAPTEMVDGLGLAETTPGPLILVTQFVGFLAAYRNPGDIDPMTAGIIGSIITLWVTFVPSFLWIFAGAPYVDWLIKNPRLSGALAGVTAAVVGVIASLAFWFGSQVLFSEMATMSSFLGRLEFPDILSANIPAILMSILAVILLFVVKLSVPWTVAAMAALGLVVGLVV